MCQDYHSVDEESCSHPRTETLKSITTQPQHSEHSEESAVISGLPHSIQNNVKSDYIPSARVGK